MHIWIEDAAFIHHKSMMLLRGSGNASGMAASYLKPRVMQEEQAALCGEVGNITWRWTKYRLRNCIQRIYVPLILPQPPPSRLTTFLRTGLQSKPLMELFYLFLCHYPHPHYSHLDVSSTPPIHETQCTVLVDLHIWVPHWSLWTFTWFTVEVKRYPFASKPWNSHSSIILIIFTLTKPVAQFSLTSWCLPLQNFLCHFAPPLALFSVIVQLLFWELFNWKIAHKYFE